MKSQITRFIDITPSDSADVASKVIPVVTVAGNLRITPVDNVDGSYWTIPVVAGQFVTVVCKRIWSTGTTATVIGGVAD